MAAQLLPAGPFHTFGSDIVDSGNNRVHFAGVNWYGFECASMVAGGLDRQPLDTICQRIVDLGFNLVRLPFCVQVVLDNPQVTAFLDANPGLQGRPALEIMDAVIASLENHGLKVILDSHRADADWSTQSNGLWYTDTVSEADWIEAWRQIVQRYRGNTTIIGCDMHNEPCTPPLDNNLPNNSGSVWGFGDAGGGSPGRNWPSAAQRAGDAVLEINPNLLIIVEGVRFDPAGPTFQGQNHSYWPGGNLSGVGNSAPPRRPGPVPIVLSVDDRLVYSAHDYGPHISHGMPWCQAGTTAETPDACRAVWDAAWGYIVKNGLAPVWIGEFGTPNHPITDPQIAHAQDRWFTYLVNYIRDHGINWCYWALNGTQSLSLPASGRNPDNPEGYGILDTTWSQAASQATMLKLAAIQT